MERFKKIMVFGVIPALLIADFAIFFFGTGYDLGYKAGLAFILNYEQQSRLTESGGPTGTSAA